MVALIIYAPFTKSLNLLQKLVPTFFKSPIVNKELVVPYNGPNGDVRSMKKTIRHSLLDISLMVGQSTISPQAGNGLFIKVNIDKHMCRVKQGNGNNVF